MSRAKHVDGFLVLRPATRKDLETRPPQYLLDELERLEKMEAESLPELLRYIRSLDFDIPQYVEDLFEPDALDKDAVNEFRCGSRHSSLIQIVSSGTGCYT